MVSGEAAATRPVDFHGLAGLAGALTFVLVVVLLQSARTDIDWKAHYVSDFANGRWGILFVIGAMVHGLGNLALCAGLRRSLVPGRLRAGAVLLFGLAALGIMAAAVFPTDPGGGARTVAGLVHRTAASVSFLLEVIALFLFSAAFVSSPRWVRYARGSFVWAAVSTAALTGLFLAVLWNRMPGLAERAALGSFLTWEVAASIALLSRRRSAVRLRALRSGLTRRVRS